MLPLRIGSLHLTLWIIDKGIQKAIGESIIDIEGVALLNTNGNRLVVKVFARHDLEVSTFVGLVLIAFGLRLNIFFRKCILRSPAL